MVPPLPSHVFTVCFIVPGSARCVNRVPVKVPRPNTGISLFPSLWEWRRVVGQGGSFSPPEKGAAVMSVRRPVRALRS